MAGYICYEGPSRLDGKPVVVIATGVGDTKSEQTKNSKTGPMVQVWILRSDIPPIEAISTGEDVSICGSCPLRGIVEKLKNRTANKMRSCYVSVKNAPRAIYESYREGNYEHLTDDVRWESQATRLGAYGDPAAIPYRVSRNLISRGNGKGTGYTHQHAHSKLQPMRKLVMASVHSEDEARALHLKGWRTFRTMKAGESLMDNEIMCPASEEAGKRLTCNECKACNGVGPEESRLGAVSVAIYAHGSPSTIGSYNRVFN